MILYNVNQGQSLLDIALELYGNPESIVRLARDNKLSLNDDLSGTMQLFVDPQVIGLVDTAPYFRLNNLHVVTDLDTSADDTIDHRSSDYNRREHR